MNTDRLVLRAMTDEIMYELMKLSGQEYVDEYAARGKSRLSSLRLGHHTPATDAADHAPANGTQATTPAAPTSNPTPTDPAP
jgi:1-acyl-sn-glycerol-3-phosphate acyltransferase